MLAGIAIGAFKRYSGHHGGVRATIHLRDRPEYGSGRRLAARAADREIMKTDTKKPGVASPSPPAAIPSAIRQRAVFVPIRNSMNMAMNTLLAHKLRSLLTIFGIVIGIAAVVLIGATLGIIREMAKKSTAQTIGSDTFIVAQVTSLGDLDRRELADKLRTHPELYRREAEQLSRNIQEIAIAAPALDETADVKAGNRTLPAVSITGSPPSIQTIRAIVLSSGRFFTETENNRAAPVAVIGQDLVDEFFPSIDPIGKHIRIRGNIFRVIGVQERQGASFGFSLDRKVYIPLPAFEKIWGSRRTVTLFVQPHEPENLYETLDQSRMAMRIQRGLRPNQPDNFDTLVPEAGRSFIERLVTIISVAIIPISSVALIVAGIVVMNMMLVSVTERTREIGIRKAIGARNRDIFAEILFESTALTMMGGAAGLTLSYLGTIGLTVLFETDVHIPFGYAVMALGVSTIIGLSAGIIPAWHASRITPVKALGYET
ncbi:MAG TPA: ABC transporter permease [Acidobacteriota bacterium]|nr:ABC transporter permease [Acidobacteriota bacterium]